MSALSDGNDALKQPGAEVETWLGKVDSSFKTDGMRKWNERCEKIRKKYRYEHSVDTRKRQYQMLWSNMEVLKPAVYQRPPKAMVSRRWRDKDPVARTAAEMLDRCINFTLDFNAYDDRFKAVRDDFLLYARGQARLFYEPEFDEADADSDDDGGLDVSGVLGAQAEVAEEQKEAAEQGTEDQLLNFEHVKIRYVAREDFAHEPARMWDEVTWVAFRAFLTREELIERFGKEIGGEIPLNPIPTPDKSGYGSSGSDGSNRQQLSTQTEDKGMIWEIWDKAAKKVLWIAKGYPEVLEKVDPYLKLTGFFPCPRPAYGTMTNDTLEPIPDYVYYQDQAEEIDTLTARIAALQESLKLVGFYPAGPQGEGSPEIERAAVPGIENRLIAVKNFGAFKASGTDGVPIVWYPVEMVATIIKECVELRKQLIDDVYQVCGISDIMRGDGQANETATAQNIKAQFGSIRIRDRQAELQRFCLDICQMIGEIIATQFQPQSIMAMANIPLPTEAELQQKAQEAAIQQQIAALAQKAQLMGHNGGPPMGGQPGPQMPPQQPQMGPGRGIMQ